MNKFKCPHCGSTDITVFANEVVNYSIQINRLPWRGIEDFGAVIVDNMGEPTEKVDQEIDGAKCQTCRKDIPIEELTTQLQQFTK